MASISELAALSSYAYGSVGLPNSDWKYLDASPHGELEISGYYGTALINEKTKEIVIANRGTRPTELKDLLTDAAIVLHMTANAQQAAINFALKIAADVRYQEYSIIETGHSLGGSEAQVATIELQKLGANVSAVTFNSPGIGGFDASGGHFNVVNYYTQGDLIHGVGGEHIGVMKELPTGPSLFSQIFFSPFIAAGPIGVAAFVAHFLFSTLISAHSIETIESYLSGEGAALGQAQFPPKGVPLPEPSVSDSALVIDVSDKSFVASVQDAYLNIQFDVNGDFVLEGVSAKNASGYLEYDGRQLRAVDEAGYHKIEITDDRVWRDDGYEKTEINADGSLRVVSGRLETKYASDGSGESSQEEGLIRNVYRADGGGEFINGTYVRIVEADGSSRICVDGFEKESVENGVRSYFYKDGGKAVFNPDGRGEWSGILDGNVSYSGYVDWAKGISVSEQSYRHDDKLFLTITILDRGSGLRTVEDYVDGVMGAPFSVPLSKNYFESDYVVYANNPAMAFRGWDFDLSSSRQGYRVVSLYSGTQLPEYYEYSGSTGERELIHVGLNGLYLDCRFFNSDGDEVKTETYYPNGKVKELEVDSSSADGVYSALRTKAFFYPSGVIKESTSTYGDREIFQDYYPSGMQKEKQTMYFDGGGRLLEEYSVFGELIGEAWSGHLEGLHRSGNGRWQLDESGVATTMVKYDDGSVFSGISAPGSLSKAFNVTQWGAVYYDVGGWASPDYFGRIKDIFSFSSKEDGVLLSSTPGLLKGSETGNLLMGSFGDDVLDGGGGDDVLMGGGGKDKYLLFAGMGNDTIIATPSEIGGEGRVIFSGGILRERVEFYLDRDNGFLYGFLDDGVGGRFCFENYKSLAEFEFEDGVEAADKIYLSAARYRSGTDGDDYILGESGGEFMFGNAGADSLYGYLGVDTLDGGGGDDLLVGGPDGTEYWVGAGGMDTIIPWVGEDPGKNGVIKFVYGQSVDSLSFYRTGDDSLFVDFHDGHNGGFVVTGYFSNEEYASPVFLFENGVRLMRPDIDQLLSVRSATVGNDYIIGTDRGDFIDGGLGDDRINSGAGDDTLIGGGGINQLDGGQGDDLYVADFAGEVGEIDLVLDRQGANNVIQLTGFGGGRFVQDGKALVLISGSGQSMVAVEDYFDEEMYSDPHAGFKVSIDGGPQMDSFAVSSVVETSWNHGGILYGTYASDSIIASSQADMVFASSGDDTVRGLDGDDSIAGGTGDDYLVGGEGSDQYFWRLGWGNDSIDAHDANSGAGDALIIDARLDQVLFERIGDDLRAQAIGDNGGVTVLNWYGDGGGRIPKIYFSSGDVLVGDQVEALVAAMAGFSPSVSGESLFQEACRIRFETVLSASCK